MTKFEGIKKFVKTERDQSINEKNKVTETRIQWMKINLFPKTQEECTVLSDFECNVFLET